MVEILVVSLEPQQQVLLRKIFQAQDRVVGPGGGGSRAAAPIARDVTLQALYKGDPPLEAYPTKDRERIREQQRALREMRPAANIAGSDQA